MTINGEVGLLGNPCTLKELLEQRGCVPDRVAVELNGEVVPKADYAATMLSDDDKIELVTFVGGG